MKIDNFELVKSFLSFKALNDYYVLQIVRRAKDYKGQNKKIKETPIKIYIVTSCSFLDSIKEEVISLCECYGARAYISITPGSFENFQRIMLLKLAAYNYKEIEVNPIKLFNQAVKESKLRPTYYLIDIDDVDDVSKQEKNVLEWFKSYSPLKEEWDMKIFPTVHGEHIVAYAFNRDAFKEEFPNIKVHKHCMGTLLYFPESINLIKQ